MAKRTSQFNPDALTRFLQGKGELYGHMILLVEEIPEDLTVWGEACPCHWALIIGLSGEQKTRMMLEHYGDGFRVCPLNGCRAPEMATGKFDEALHGIWDLRQSELIQKAAELNVALDSASWEIVSNDFTNAETYSFMILQLKLDFWKRLPWI